MTSSYPLRLFILLTTFFTLSLCADEKVLDASDTYSNVIDSAYYLEDSEKNLDFDTVASMDESRFHTIRGGAAGFTFSASAYWFRFRVENNRPSALKRLLAFEPTWLDKVDVRVMTPVGDKQTFRGGDRYPGSERDFDHPNTIFSLDFVPGVSTVIVRVETRDPFVVAMELWEEHAFYEHDDGFSKYIGFFYGILIAMGVYNLFLFFAIRDRLYAFYVLYIAFFLMMNFTYSGYSFFYLWPEHPEWGNWAHSILIYLYTLSGLFFAVVFLNIKKRLPKVHKVFVGYVVLVVAVFIISAFTGGYAHNVFTSILFVVLFSLFAFILGIVSWLNGNRTARFFILATTAGLFGAATTAFTVSSILPFNFFTYRAADLGMILDAMLLSLALADRYKALERERDTLRFREEKQQELLAQKEAFAHSLEARVQEELLKNRKQEAIMLKQHQQAALGSMIGVIAHQLKQPLNAINLYVQGLAEDYQAGELDAGIVERTKENVWRSVIFMSETIDDFRNYFRPDKRKKDFNLYDTIAKTLSLLDAQIKTADVAISVSGRRAIRLVSFESELQQVLLNLVANAIDIFAERQTAEPMIAIEMSEREGKITISVEDNGGGIPGEILPHMFELYFTTKGEAGTGLGLYMSKMIVNESLGGEIGVENTGKGARFTITVPGIPSEPKSQS